jgi:hypothetical protein
MTIEIVSRYNDGPLFQLPDKYSSIYNIGVFRKWPSTIQRRYVEHTWEDGDSLGALAARYGDGSKYWWEIMEINPEIINPLNITPGTVVRVPYGNQ